MFGATNGPSRHAAVTTVATLGRAEPAGRLRTVMPAVAAAVDFDLLSRVSSFIFGMIGLAASAAADPSINLKPGSLDPTLGQIDGRAAMAVVPRPEHLGNATKLIAKLSPMGDSGLELAFPVGSWFIPPLERKYRVWLEGEWEISPFTQLIVWNGGRFMNRGAVVQPPLGPAGRVVVPRELEARGNLTLRLLSLGDYLDHGFLRWELMRQERIPSLPKEGILMPAGPAMAALWDLDHERYEALSRPFKVMAGDTVAVPFEGPPAGRAALVALLENHGLSRAEDRLEVLLDQGKGERAPEVLSRTAQTVYAVWYDLDPDRATLRVRRGTGPAQEPFVLSLQANRISRVSLDLRKGELIWRGGPRALRLQK